MNKENQAKIIELVKQAKPLILQEMTHEKVTEKGAADYVTNVDVAVQNYLKEALEKECDRLHLQRQSQISYRCGQIMASHKD